MVISYGVRVRVCIKYVVSNEQLHAHVIVVTKRFRPVLTGFIVPSKFIKILSTLHLPFYLLFSIQAT